MSTGLHAKQLMGPMSTEGYHTETGLLAFLKQALSVDIEEFSTCSSVLDVHLYSMSTISEAGMSPSSKNTQLINSSVVTHVRGCGKVCGNAWKGFLPDL